MKFWNVFSLQAIVDCELNFNRKEMKEIRIAAFQRDKKATLTIIGIGIIVFPLLAFGISEFNSWIYFNVWQSIWVIVLKMPMIMAIIFPLLIALTRSPVCVRPIRRELCRRGIDICLKCGYWLKELPLEQSKHCPECGHERPPVPSEPLPDTSNDTEANPPC